MNAIDKGVTHFRAGVERAEDFDGLDSGAGELGRNVVGDTRQTDHVDLEHLSGGQRSLEVCTAEML